MRSIIIDGDAQQASPSDWGHFDVVQFQPGFYQDGFNEHRELLLSHEGSDSIAGLVVKAILRGTETRLRLTPLTRRHLSARLETLTFASCAPESVVDNSIVSPEPSQDPGVSAPSVAVTELFGVISRQFDPWRVATLARTSTWQGCLLAIDPFVGDEPVFPEASLSPPTSRSSDPGVGLTATTQLVVDTATKAPEEVQHQPMRLLHLSVPLAAKDLTNPDVLPGEVTNKSYQYQDVVDKITLGTALTHVWALLQAPEKGLGLMSPRDSQHVVLLARHIELKDLRDRLIAVLGTDRPRQDGHYELPSITNAASLQATQTVLELKLLGGLAGAVAAADEKDWLNEALARVPRVQAPGGKLSA